MIPYGRQTIEADDVAAVVAVLSGDFLTQGPEVERFEAALCDVTGARFAVAMSSGTTALHAALAAAGIGAGDRVATSPLTFVASANAARYVGADVELVDVDPSTWNLDLGAVPTGVDALVAVHYAGLPVDLAALSRSGARPRVVVEDAAHALGASTPDGPVGNCAHSDMCCFSFHPVKTVTTGEGGAVTTNSPALADALRRFRHHGVVRRDGDPHWRYDVPELGYNARLTDLQAALGTSQLAKLDRFGVVRDRLAARYRDAFTDDPRVELPPEAPAGWRHGRHLFVVGVDDRDRVFEELRARGVGVQVHYVPVYRFGAYGGGRDVERFPHTERVFSRIISLPLYPLLADDDQDLVIATLRAVL